MSAPWCSPRMKAPQFQHGRHWCTQVNVTDVIIPKDFSEAAANAHNERVRQSSRIADTSFGVKRVRREVREHKNHERRNTMSKFKDLMALMEEASTLTMKENMTRTEQRRLDVLLASMAAVKAGVSLSDIQREQLNEMEKRNGLPITDWKQKRTTALSKKQEKRAREFQAIVHQGIESRDSSEGDIKAQVGTFAGIGSFVPVEFYNKLFRAMKWIDPLFEIATVITTQHGRAIAVPTLGDIENVAVPVGENSFQEANGHDLSKPSHVSLGAFSFRTPLFRLSLEAFDDLETSLTARGLFETFASDRVARGFGKLAINGTGDGVTGIKGIVKILSDSGSSTCYRDRFRQRTPERHGNGCEHHRLQRTLRMLISR